MVPQIVGNPVENWIEVFEAIIGKIKVALDEMVAKIKALLGKKSCV